VHNRGETFILDNCCKITLLNEELTLLPYKAIYIERYKTLIAADIHLGKVGHFRDAGIAIPGGLAEADLMTLTKILKSLEITDILVLGDMFHAGVNYDVRLFDDWRNRHHDIDISLIKGNHDIFSDEIYKHFDVFVHKKYFLWKRFLLTHKPLPDEVILNGCDYIFSGHVHPGVKLSGKGKQSISLPCFHFTEKQCILPAFGEFTGKYLISPCRKDRVYVITKSEGDYKVMKAGML
jgi:DNA ligase-associated metallophosphoesterase